LSGDPSLADELTHRLGVTELRLPAHHILEYLRQEGWRLRPASLRNWTRRRFISHTEDGYDLLEVIRLLERHAVTGKLTTGDEHDTLSAGEACPQSGSRAA
jgi:hypothetical protein